MIHKYTDSENLLGSLGSVSCSPVGKSAKVVRIEKMTYSRISLRYFKFIERDEMTSA